LRLEVEKDLVLGRHDLALGRLVTYVMDVANGKQPRPSDALLAGLRQDLLALARETQAIAVKTKSRRFMILGLAAYQLLDRLPLPACEAVDANVWQHEQDLALYQMLSEEAGRLPQPPPAPTPARKPGDRRAFPSIVRISTAVITGVLEAAAVRQVVRRRLPEVRACYEQALVRAPVAGVLQLKLFVDGWGRVTLASVLKNGTVDAAPEELAAQEGHGLEGQVGPCGVRFGPGPVGRNGRVARVRRDPWAPRCGKRAGRSWRPWRRAALARHCRGRMRWCRRRMDRRGAATVPVGQPGAAMQPPGCPRGRRRTRALLRSSPGGAS